MKFIKPIINHYPIETLLRDPIEYSTAACMFSVSAFLALQPGFVPPSLAYTTSSIIALWGIHYLRRGLYVTKFQNNLKAHKEYTLSPEDIPKRKGHTFLGMGFHWQQIHTQRLKNTRETKFSKYCQPDTAKKQPPLGGNPRIHGVETEIEPIFLSHASREGHIFVNGSTGSGKSSQERLFIEQDIATGHAVFVFDPKLDPKVLKTVISCAKRNGRESDLIIFNLGDLENSCAYNPVGNYQRITEVAGRMVTPISDEGSSKAFRDLVWYSINVIARALEKLNDEHSYQAIYNHIVDIEKLIQRYSEMLLNAKKVKGWKNSVKNIQSKLDEKLIPNRHKNKERYSIALIAFIRNKDHTDEIFNSLFSLYDKSTEYLNKITSSLYVVMEKLLSGQMGEILMPQPKDSKRRELKWDEAIQEKQIVYFGLDAATDIETCLAIGGPAIADLASISGRINKEMTEKPDPIWVHLDEVEKILVNELLLLTSMGRGSGFNVTSYTQTSADPEVRLGSKAKADQFYGNFNTLINFRVKNHETARNMTDQLEMVEVVRVIEDTTENTSGDVMSSNDFSTSNRNRIDSKEAPLIGPPDIIHQPIGQCFALLDGGTLYHIQVPLLDDSGDEFIDQSMLDVTQEMQRRYTSSLEVFDGQ